MFVIFLRKLSVPDFLEIGDNLVCGRGKYGGNTEPAHLYSRI